MSKSSNSKLHYQSLTMGNLLPTFPEVIKQIFESLFKYRTLDLKWKYRKEGF